MPRKVAHKGGSLPKVVTPSTSRARLQGLFLKLLVSPAGGAVCAGSCSPGVGASEPPAPPSACPPVAQCAWRAEGTELRVLSAAAQ